MPISRCCGAAGACVVSVAGVSWPRPVPSSPCGRFPWRSSAYARNEWIPLPWFVFSFRSGAARLGAATFKQFQQGLHAGDVMPMFFVGPRLHQRVVQRQVRLLVFAQCQVTLGQVHHGLGVGLIEERRRAVGLHRVRMALLHVQASGQAHVVAPVQVIAQDEQGEDAGGFRELALAVQRMADVVHRLLRFERLAEQRTERLPAQQVLDDRVHARRGETGCIEVHDQPDLPAATASFSYFLMAAVMPSMTELKRFMSVCRSSWDSCDVDPRSSTVPCMAVFAAAIWSLCMASSQWPSPPRLMGGLSRKPFFGTPAAISLS